MPNSHSDKIRDILNVERAEIAHQQEAARKWEQEQALRQEVLEAGQRILNPQHSISIANSERPASLRWWAGAMRDYQALLGERGVLDTVLQQLTTEGQERENRDARAHGLTLEVLRLAREGDLDAVVQLLCEIDALSEAAPAMEGRIGGSVQHWLRRLPEIGWAVLYPPAEPAVRAEASDQIESGAAEGDSAKPDQGESQQAREAEPEEKLSEREKELLLAYLALGADSKRRKVSRTQAARKADPGSPPTTYNRANAALGRRGYLQVAAPREGGGCWLTSVGKAAAEALRPPRQKKD
jgi:hypothetical protein